MYEEAAPPGPLRGVARCVWRSAAAAPKRIVPDGCLDLVAGESGVFVAGPDTTAWSSVTRPGEVLRGVRFTPGRAAAVLGVAADELRDRRVPLRELWGREGELLAERLLSGELSPAAVVAARLADVPPPDPAVAALITRLDAGAARVAEAVGPVAVAERRLRRRFVQAVGYGPATYLRVSRFQRAVSLAPRIPGLAALAVAAGYADQAHLSRDCRSLTGLTPRAHFPGPSIVDGARSEVPLAPER
jgi:AraC-like DNA-binding protein